jgi:hypothetical protein
MEKNIPTLVEQLSGEIGDKTYEASDSLAHLG